MKMKEKRTMDFNSTKENSYSTTVDSRLHFGLSRENAELLHTASIYTLCAFIFFPTRSLSTNHKLKWMSIREQKSIFQLSFVWIMEFFVYKIMQIIHYYWFLWNILIFIEIILKSKEHSFSGSFLTFYSFF